ncbi:MAG: hypothetical protein QOE86_4519 [Solirubrobacteraceae bacterium]|nr:hypothetical protein [Solirubrobacteraceae bacterium]
MAFSAAMSSPAVSLRPVQARDRHALAAAFDRLSPESRYHRFLGPKNELTARELTYLTDVDHVTHEAFVAIDPATEEIVGVARYALGSSGHGDFAVVVADAWQRRGLGTALARRVIARAAMNGFAKLSATTLWENEPARGLCAKLGFRSRGGSHGVLDLELDLRLPASAPGSVAGNRWSSVS